MKNLWLYLMVFVYCFSSPGTVELLKIPYIAVHFLEHRSLNHNITITDFISMHYLGKDIKDNDADRDSKLPFKKILHSHGQTLFQNTAEACLPLALTSLHPVLTFLYNAELVFVSSIKLFRPPQPTVLS